MCSHAKIIGKLQMALSIFFTSINQIINKPVSIIKSFITSVGGGGVTFSCDRQKI